MLVKDLIEQHVAALIAPGLGQRPNTSDTGYPQDGRRDPECWGCGLKGHKKGVMQFAHCPMPKEGGKAHLETNENLKNVGEAPALLIGLGRKKSESSTKILGSVNLGPSAGGDTLTREGRKDVPR